jgi:dTDP-4-dehydrorhamnose 3,5-epimerase-like enzyme
MKALKQRNNIKPCKKVVTFDPKTKKKNGWLLEVISDTDSFTKHLHGQIYLTVANPGEFKGYHMHAGADYFVTCLKGKIKEIIYKSKDKKQEVIMGDGHFKTVFLPRGYPHAVQNIGKGPAYVLVYRYPSWSPKIKEQLDISRNRITTSDTWRNIRAFIKKFNEK